MKRRSHLAALATVTVLLGATAARSRDALPKTPQPPVPAHTGDVSVGLGHQLHQQLAQVRRQLENPFTEVRRATGELTRNAVAATTRLHSALALPGAANRSSQSLLIRTRDLNPESQTQLEEDLNVMARIVEKATQTDSIHSPRAMGIDLVFGPSMSPVRSLYLDGYGALFMVNVNFPLLPAPATDEEASEEAKGKTESSWEQARQELYGNPRPRGPMMAMGWTAEHAEGQAYDAAKVERLRQALLESIRNASNIRELSADESVTLCVVGAPWAANTNVRVVRRKAAPNNYQARAADASSDVETRLEEIVVHEQVRGDLVNSTRAVMTLQASKADIDRFARGEISPEQFRELARTQTYPAGGGWNAPNALFWNNH